MMIKILKQWWPLFLIVLVTSCAKTTEMEISSRNGVIDLYFFVDEESPAYYITFHDTLIVDTSRLKITFEDSPPLGPGLKITEAKISSEYKRWKPVWGEEDRILDRHNRLLVMLEETSEPYRKLHVEFKIYNDGAGFRYIFPEQENWDTLLIREELTEFNLAGDYSAWWIPGDYDSYEHLYRNTAASEIDSANTPVTFETGSGKYLSIHEANLTDYAGMTLKKAPGRSHGLVSSLVPWPDGIKVKAGIPHQTPWRTITITDDASGLLLSRMILNLNEPNEIEDISWIRPMKYAGIWWGMHIGKYTWHEGPKHGATTENAMRYIDFAAANDLGGVLVEGWNKGWESWFSGDTFDLVTPADDFDLVKVVEYARSKSVEIIGHHETGGNIPLYEKYLDSAFALYSSLGINTVKTGYAGKIRPEGFHHHGQWMVNHYRRVLLKAVEHQIMIDAHEPIKATGLRRTYPNMMTREGARGMEYNAWSPGNPPSHTCILPFTRLLGGPLDYTPGIFDLHFNDFKPDNRVHTTLSKQLALYVVIYSPLQMVADLPENYEGNEAFNFIRQVPSNWDETRVLNAKIGDYVTYARRKDGDWFIGSVTDELARTHWIKFDFLEKETVYDADFYLDGDNASWKENPYSINIYKKVIQYGDSAEIRLAEGGGAAIHLKAR